MKQFRILALALALLAVSLTAFADPINVGGTNLTMSSPINVGGTSFESLPATARAFGITGKPGRFFEAELLLDPINVGGT